jgi:hypothetical protein
MYNDMIYRNDELKRDLEQASREAARGWRLRHMQSSRPKLIVTAVTILGSMLIEVGQWLAVQGRPRLACSARREQHRWLSGKPHAARWAIRIDDGRA